MATMRRPEKQKFPPEFDKKVDLQKINVEVMKRWIESRISELLGFDDDVTANTCCNMFDKTRNPNIKEIQNYMVQFLGSTTATNFCKELWDLCLSAQDSQQGVPKKLIEARAAEIQQEKAEAEKAAQAAQKRRDEEDTRERRVHDIREREQTQRDRDRNRRRGNDEDFRSKPRRHSRSRSRSPYRPGENSRRHRSPRRDVDTYIPSYDRREYRSRRRRSSDDSPPPRNRHRQARDYHSPSPGRQRHDRRERSTSSSISPSPVRKSRGRSRKNSSSSSS